MTKLSITILAILTFGQPISVFANKVELKVRINGVECVVLAPATASTYKGKRGSKKEPPESLLYTQATISPTYTDGEYIGEKVDDTPDTAVAEFPPIRLFDTVPNKEDWECGQTYSLDNRRLWVAKKYNRKIKTTPATATEILDAIDRRKDFFAFEWAGGNDIESCESGDIYFETEEAKKECFEEDSSSSGD